MPLSLLMQTKSEVLFEGQVERVKLPGEAGQFEVCLGHAPLVATLKQGEVIYDQGGKKQRFPIGEGVARVEKDHVTLLIWGKTA